jgi:sugar transferase (PEP-CTERM system associated)
MTRIFGHCISIEMLWLWLVETVLFFSVFYVLLAAGTDLHLGSHLLGSQIALPAMVLAITIGLTSVAIGLYRPEICFQVRQLAVNTTVAGVLAFPAILAVGGMFGYSVRYLVTDHILKLLGILLAWIVCLVVTRVLFYLAVRANLFARRILVVGSGNRAVRLGEVIAAKRGPFFEVAAVMASDAPLAPEWLRQNKIWGIVVAKEARTSVLGADLLRCKCHGIRVFNDGEFNEQQSQRVDIENLAPDWLAFAETFSCTRTQLVLRRAADILISLGFLVFTLPLMVLSALAIKLDSPGPVFYLQERIGLHGKIFMVCKLRSMRVDAEAGQGPCWAGERDPRVTRVGRLIRLLRIDELPQLLNVLRGEMSFIGPRPERPAFVEHLSQAIPRYGDRACVKPGITGWAQVNFPYGASIEDARVKLSYDLYYVKHRSFFLDLVILISTVRVILFQEGSR